MVEMTAPVFITHCGTSWLPKVLKFYFEPDEGSLEVKMTSSNLKASSTCTVQCIHRYHIMLSKLGSDSLTFPHSLQDNFSHTNRSSISYFMVKTEGSLWCKI